MGNPAALGTYLLLACPFSLCLLQRPGRPGKALGSVTLILGLTCLFLTFSRSAFMGLIAMMAFYLIMVKDIKRLLLFGLLFLVFSNMMALLPYPFNRLTLNGTLFQGRGFFTAFRSVRFDIAAQMFRDSPFWGVGLNHFRVLFDQYYTLKDGMPLVPFEHKIADNMYLTLWAETGLAGISGLLIFMTTLFARGIKKIKALRGNAARSLRLIPFVSLVGFLVNMNGYEIWYWPNLYLFFCLICGFMQGGTEDPEGVGVVSHG